MSRKDLLAAVEGRDIASYLELIKQHVNKRSSVNLHEVVAELNHGQLETIWIVLHSWADDQLAKMADDSNADNQSNPSKDHSLEKVSQDFGEDRQSENQKESDGNPTKINNEAEPYSESLMLGILKFGNIYVSSIKGPEAFIPEKFLELIVLLHEMVSILVGDVQEEVISLCELWWHQELEERDYLIRNVVPFLISSALADTSRKKDVIRVYNIRDALHVIEFDRPLLDLLSSCAGNLRFVSCDEGVKWLSELFSWQVLVPDLHRSIKSVLPECTKDQSAKYAEVYFRAWKKSMGNVKQLIEEDCWQDLMYAAIHVSPTLAVRLSTNLHHFLHHLHRHKRHHVVQKTLLDLYSPFLWRSLKAANGYVRMNAAGLLCDVFPLMDGMCTLDEKEELMEKQYQTLIMLLTDPCHLVRITAIKGVCNILNNYWLMVPSNVIKIVFQKLVTELLFDVSSAEVRIQVVKGLTLLLSNNDAVPFLKEVLPRISDSFDDICTGVRLAFVSLLLKVKSLKIIRYWSIVPVQHLLHRLEEDVPSVCKLITQLLLNSFHPKQRTDQELLQRCLSLIDENRLAARRFYRYASRSLDLSSTVHFMLLIWTCLRNYVISRYQDSSTVSEGNSSCDNIEEQGSSSRLELLKSNASNRRSLQGVRSMNSEDKENRVSENKDNGVEEGEDDDESPLEDPSVVAGLLDTMVVLWATNAYQLAQPKNQKYLEALRSKVPGGLARLFKYFKENKEISQTLLYLSSFLPKNLVPTFVGHCLSHLRSLQQKELQEDDDIYATYVNALCNWNRFDDILELATEWLMEGFNSSDVSNAKERRRSKRCVRFHEAQCTQPSLALSLIRNIIQNPLNKLGALSRNRQQVMELAETLKTSKSLITERLNRGEEFSSLCSDQFLCSCWAQYLSLVPVLHTPVSEPAERTEETVIDDETDDVESPNTTFNGCEHLLDCLDWANSVLIPVLRGEEIGEKRKLRAGEDAVRIANDALKHLVTTSCNMIVIGVADIDFVYKLCTFTKVLMKSDASENFWDLGLNVVVEAVQFLEVYESVTPELDESIATPVDLMNSCIVSISENLREEKTLPKEAENLNKALCSALTILYHEVKGTPKDILEHMVAAIIDEICFGVDRMHGVDRQIEKVAEMSPSLALFIGTCQSRVKLSAALMETITHFILHCAVDSTTILALAHLVEILSKDNGKISKYDMKQAVEALDTVLLKTLFPANLEDTRGTDGSVDIYEDYMKIGREIVDSMKSSLVIV